jgi:hypothetical protein
MLVVPADDSIDASTVVAELSLTFAQVLDEYVLALDADLPRTAESPRDDASAGLAEVLFERLDWRAAVGRTRDRRVQLLSAGARAAPSSALAGASALVVPLVSEIKTRYRLTIVHGGMPGGPLTGALVKACDLVYLVLELGGTTRRSARAAKRRLENLGAVVHGCILTGAQSGDVLPPTGLRA